MDERLDPVQIIARPSRMIAQDQTQAFGVWMHAARKAGWQVDVADESVEWSAGECGVVEVEGLRYLVRVGLRGRGRAVTVPDGHVGSHVAQMAAGRGSFVSEAVFVLTVWAEPVL
jgi:hypothetical protein